MRNISLILLTAMLFLNSCSTQKKFAKLFQEGYTQEESFKVKIPFEYRLGLMIIKVDINKETYDFVLDSGGVNLLSKELAKKLGSKGLITQNTGGHQGNYQPMDFTKIEALSIGGIKFEETACGIGDFNQSMELGCIELDGMIGANLMRLAVWEFDFSNQIITITNTKESLALGAKTKKIPFYTDAVHKPYCNVKINGVEEKNVIIDLGSNLDFSFSHNNYEQIQKALPSNKKAIEYGYPGSGYYGFDKIDSTYYLQAEKLSIGEIRLNRQILKFSKTVSPHIGTAFLKNYDLVMNWADNEILLSPHTVYDNQQFTNRISVNCKDGALRVASLVQESEVDVFGIQIGDKIIQMDGKDYSAITEEMYCDLISRLYKNSQITYIVVNRNGQELTFHIKNNVIIE